MKDLLAGGAAALERIRALDLSRHAILDEARIKYLPPIPDADKLRVNTRDQIWKLPDILEHFSRFIPIEPGDMFSTGAPGGVAVGKPNAADFFLKPGDVVECGIEAISTLRTFIV